MDEFTPEQKIEYETLMENVKKAYPSVPEAMAQQVVECWVENPKVINEMVELHKADADCFLTEEDKECSH